MFLRARFYYAWGAGLVLCTSGMLWYPLLYLGVCLIGFLILLTVVEYIQITRASADLLASRRVDSRLSLVDDNPVSIRIINTGASDLSFELVDELPQQFQKRDFGESFSLSAASDRLVKYTLRPTERGVYTFGNLLLFVGTKLGLVQRRLAFGEVNCYDGRGAK